VEALRKNERLVQNRMKLGLAQKVVHFWVWPPTPWMLMYFFAGFFLISPGFEPNSGYRYWLYRILYWEMSYVSNQTQGNGRHWKTNLLCDTSNENWGETHPTSLGIHVVEICQDLFGLA
jgi:hypothetical protein